MKYGLRKLSIEFLEPRRLFATVNLAKFQSITADSNINSDSVASFAVDGVVSNDYRWISDNTGPHWLEVNLSAPYEIGSAHVYLGLDTGLTVSSFSIQYFSGGNWVTAASVTSNTATELKVPFSSTVSGVTRFRFYTTVATARVKEFVLLPPGDFPLGTGVNLNLASQRNTVASSVYGVGNFAINTVDGWVDDNSRWLADSTVGPHSIELNLSSSQTTSPTQPKTSHLVGSLHLYSGFLSSGNVVSPLASFTVEYANLDSGWLPISGGTVSSGMIVGNQVSNNTSPSLVVNFASPVTATAMRVSFSAPFGRIRELVVLPATNRADGVVGYPIGTSVQIAPKPSTLFEQYGDSFFRINTRVNNNSLVSTATSSSLISSSTVSQASQYQLLYSYALDAYRLRNHDTGQTIEVAGASMLSGAAIVEGDYSASPHQLWRLIPTDTGYFQIVNVWSGMVLDVDVSGASPVVTQKARDTNTNPDNRQEWTTTFVSNNIKKGTGGYVGQFGASWAYNWGPSTSAENDPAVIDKDFLYVPMQWGAHEAWINRANKLYGNWQNNGKPQFLLGFNEPDKADQSNVTVERAVEAWPQLVAADLPLISPANATGGEAWLQSFSDQVDALGYRVDYTGMHWYAPPNVNTILSQIDSVQTKGNGRPVWLTEFSIVDWSNGSGDWSEETNYNFILEFLWRAESKANLEKYAIFIFTGDSPTNPWDLANPRSNFRFNDGTLTPFGKAYATWDNDTAIRNNTPYVLHNRAASHRVANNGGSSLNASSIRIDDATVQWQLRDAGGGKKYIESGVDGRMLRYNGTTLDYAPAGTAGTAVEWTISQEQYGWRNIIHPQTGKYLQLNRTNNASNAPTALNYTMVTAAAATTTASNWWFAKPYEPISDIGPVTDSAPVANQVNENSPVGAIVGVTANATEPDQGQTVSYSLTNNAGGRFAINPTTGVVTVAGSLDYESATSHSITIQATSSDSTTSSAIFVVDIGNINENPTNIGLSNNSIIENAGTNAVIGAFSATDPDAGSSFTFSLPLGLGSNSLFNISGTSLRASSSFDFELQTSYPITVRVTDNGGLTFDKAFTINITNSTDTTAPTVTSIIAASSTWLPTFVDAVDGGGVGTGNGLGISLASNQTIPNSGGIDRIYIQFSESVVGFNASRVKLLGVNTVDYTSSLTVSYDAVNMRGMIQVASGIVKDKLRVGISEAVTDVELNALDGDSNASAGGIYNFRFNVLVGDANNDGSVNGGDLPIFSNSFNKSFGNALYNSRGDWNSDGSVNGGDLPLFAGNFNQSLPASDPGSLNFPPPPPLLQDFDTEYAPLVDAFYSDLDEEDVWWLLNGESV